MKKSKQPVIQHIADFLDYAEIEKGLSDNTQRNYQRYLGVFATWLKKNEKGGLLPHQVTPELVWQYRLYLARKHTTPQGKNLSKATQNYYLVALRALLNYFSDRDIESLPSSKIKLPKGAKQDSVKFLTLEQIKQLLAMPDIETKKGLRDRAIMEALFSTGLRISELANLDREQISFKNMDEGLELSITGKGNSTRSVYFSPRALKWMKKYLDNRDDTEKPLFVNYKTSNPDNRRLSVRSIQAAIRRYGHMAALPVEVTPHVLRHSYATDLLRHGVDIRNVQEFLGHKNIATTQIYTHVTKQHLKDIHKKHHGGNELEE